MQFKCTNKRVGDKMIYIVERLEYDEERNWRLEEVKLLGAFTTSDKAYKYMDEYSKELKRIIRKQEGFCEWFEESTGYIMQLKCKAVDIIE